MSQSNDDGERLTQFSVNDISAPQIAVSGNPDAETKLGLLGYKRLEIHNDRLLAEVESLRQDILQRGKYAPKIFVLSCCWLGFVLVILLLQGFFNRSGLFRLDDSVLLALMGTTTVNVIGLFYLVAKYLFPIPQGNKFRSGKNINP